MNKADMKALDGQWRAEQAELDRRCQYRKGTDCTLRLRNQTCLLECGETCDENEAE